MVLSSIVEKWDGILYSVYNALYDIKTLFIKRHYSRNKELRDKYKGKRCFVIMNGPSLNKHDLSFLKNEVVFASNYFYRADISNLVEPNYYCWADSKVFFTEEGKTTIDEIRKSCLGVKFVLHHAAECALGHADDIYYEYCKHIPNIFKVRNNLAGLTSNFGTVAFHAINIALYMGFKEVYVLGLDFAPGAFKHFTDLDAECEDPSKISSKLEVCRNYWQYTKCQYESYALADFANKRGQRIVNLNPESCVRAFEFGNYEKLFQK